MSLNALHYANSLSASDRAALAQLIQFSEQIAALRTRQRHLQTGDISKAAVLEALGLAADIAALRQQQAMLAARIIASIPSECLEPIPWSCWSRCCIPPSSAGTPREAPVMPQNRTGLCRSAWESSQTICYHRGTRQYILIEPFLLKTRTWYRLVLRRYQGTTIRSMGRTRSLDEAVNLLRDTAGRLNREDSTLVHGHHPPTDQRAHEAGWLLSDARRLL